MNDDVIEREDAPELVIGQLSDGVYFGLPEDAYHAQQRMSSSGIQDMLVSEADFWARSWLNPERKDEDTQARRLGRAYHLARLEPGRFLAEYCRGVDAASFPGALDNEGVKDAIRKIVPQKENFEGLLATDADVKAALAAMGQPQSVKGEDARARADRLAALAPDRHIWARIVADFEAKVGPMTGGAGEDALARAKRLRSYGYEGPIFALEEARWREEVGDREAISPVYFDQIIADIAAIRGNEKVSAYLTGGAAEVSILWTDEATGVKMKARIDYLRAEGVTDFKTFDNAMRKPLHRCIADAFRFNRYYVQAAVYHDAVEAVRQGRVALASGGARPPTPEEVAIVADIQLSPLKLPMHYVFQQKGGVPNLLAVAVAFYADVHPSLKLAEIGANPFVVEQLRQQYRNPAQWYVRARQEITFALDRFKVCQEVFGNEPWRTIEDERAIGDADFPTFWLEMREA